MNALVPDFDTYRENIPLALATNNATHIKISWPDGKEHHLHLVWLRENCPCNQCRNEEVREQTILLADIPDDLFALECCVTDQGHLRITWSDNQHQSTYHSGWLYQTLTAAPPMPVRQTWDAQFAENLPLIDGADIVDESSPAFAEWINAIARFGVGILTGTPASPETVERLAGMIGPVRPSNFGYTFDVISKKDADSLAYTSNELKPHTDLATREYQPGLQFLHCIKNDADGGESVLVDGFRIAEIIRDNHPDEYQTLTTIALEFRNVAKTSDYRWTTPVICLNEDGSFDEIRMTYWLRAPMNVPLDTHDRIYKALRLYMALADSPENKIIYKLNPGDLLAFDNRRFLHGRLAYQLDSGERWLRGCYGEREELFSRQKVLERMKV